MYLSAPPSALWEKLLVLQPWPEVGISAQSVLDLMLLHTLSDILSLVKLNEFVNI